MIYLYSNIKDISNSNYLFENVEKGKWSIIAKGVTLISEETREGALLSRNGLFTTVALNNIIEKTKRLVVCPELFYCNINDEILKEIQKETAQKADILIILNEFFSKGNKDTLLEEVENIFVESKKPVIYMDDFYAIPNLEDFINDFKISENDEKTDNSIINQ